MILNLILILVMLTFAAFYAGSEIAFIVANRLKVEIKSRNKTFLGIKAFTLMSNPEKYLAISLVGTNISHVAFSSLTTVLLASTFGLDAAIILIITSLTILIVGEIIPKSFFRENADSFIEVFTVFLLVSNIVLYPINFVVMNIAKIFSKMFGTPLTPEHYVHTKEDILSLISESEDAGQLEDESGEYFKKAFELKEVPVSELMIHRTEICAVPKNISMQKLFSTFIETKHSKIFVYDSSIDNILGVIHVKDLFSDSKSILQITKEVIYVPETKSSTELLRQFILSGQSVAVAVDEFGGTSGIVAMEDILEEVIGEIESEYDSEKLSYKKIDDSTFILNGRVELDIINDIYGFNLPVADYLTIGGLVSGISGRVPRKNEIIQIDKYKFTVLKSTNTTIDLVKLETKP
jgi:putative hemolysin